MHTTYRIPTVSATSSHARGEAGDGDEGDEEDEERGEDGGDPASILAFFLDNTSPQARCGDEPAETSEDEGGEDGGDPDSLLEPKDWQMCPFFGSWHVRHR